MDALGFKALSSRKIPCSGRKKDVRPWVRKDGTKPDYFEIADFYQDERRGEDDFWLIKLEKLFDNFISHSMVD